MKDADFKTDVPGHSLARLVRRISELETALHDCVSTYRDDDKTVLVTAERQETWRAVLAGATWEAPRHDCGEVILRVPMPAWLSHTGEFRWSDKAVDGCIAPLVQALNDAGIHTANCCCGHGRAWGWITLHDGREIVVIPPNDLFTESSPKKD